MMTSFFHELLSVYFRQKSQSFIQHSHAVERSQRKILRKILKNLKNTRRWNDISVESSYEALATSMPLGIYEDYKEDILEQKLTKKNVLAIKVKRFEPTSGSTSERKWIPYSQDYIDELNQAAAVWLGDVYHKYPGIKKGRHYWSLSWLPEELRKETSSDDSELFGFFEKLLLKKTMLMPSKISQVRSADGAWWGTLVYLVSAKDLTLISVWSPTYLLKACSDIKLHWNDIQLSLQTGKWKKFSEELDLVIGEAPRRNTKNLNPNDPSFFEELWPQLTLISCWASSSSQKWSEELKNIFPKISFQEKGLWATEGVVSIPFQNKKVLCINTHFYEFIDLETQEIVPAWKLVRNKTYQPIIWNSSGLLRYQMQDQVKVVDYFHDTPCLEFLGRIKSVDMVGEKMDSQWVAELFQRNPSWQALTLMAFHKPKPHYTLYTLGNSIVDIESDLLNVHHYKVARELGQLERAQVVAVDSIDELWERTGQSLVIGQNKIEVLKENKSNGKND